MDEIKELTIPGIDKRLAEIPTRLAELDELIRVKKEELAKSFIGGLLTPPIHKSIRSLEDEQRELSAGLEYLTLERERIQKANEQKIAEDAAAKYEQLREQLNQKGIAAINSLCDAQKQFVEYEKIQSQMDGEKTLAGNLINPGASLGEVKIQTGQIGNHIYQALYRIKSFNGPERLAAAGIQIPDYYQELEKVLGISSVSVSYGVPESNTNESEQPEPRSGFEAAMHRAAGLSE